MTSNISDVLFTSTISSEDKPFMVYEIYFSQKSSQAREEPGRNRILVRNIIALANSFQQNHDKK